MRYYIGIDLASKSSAVCILDEERKIIEEIQTSTDEEFIKKALSRYKKAKCIVEASPLAEWLCNIVEKLGHEIEIVCPRRAKIALSSKKKTDRRDALALAELCRSGFYTAVHRKSAEAREMRSYMTARKQLVKCSSSLCSAISGILRAHGVKLGVGSDDKGYIEKVKTAIEKLPKMARDGVKELLRSYEKLHKQQRDMYKRLNKHAKIKGVTKRLLTIPGVGPATAEAFVATIDDPKRFSDGEKVASYIGLTSSVYQSGETEYRGRITKAGDRLLRWLLVEAAHVLLSRSESNCELRTWGLRLEKVKGAGKARVAVARRLAVIMWKIWVDGSIYEPKFLSV